MIIVAIGPRSSGCACAMCGMRATQKASATKATRARIDATEAKAQPVETASSAHSARSAPSASSGIDASGKGTVAAGIEHALAAAGLRVALIGLDPWHHPRSVRFSDVDPAEHFYANAYRFDDLFSELIDPLRAHRSVRTSARL